LCTFGSGATFSQSFFFSSPVKRPKRSKSYSFFMAFSEREEDRVTQWTFFHKKIIPRCIFAAKHFLIFKLHTFKVKYMLILPLTSFKSASDLLHKLTYTYIFFK
jgi:hypothetical protein